MLCQARQIAVLPAILRLGSSPMTGKPSHGLGEGCVLVGAEPEEPPAASITSGSGSGYPGQPVCPAAAGTGEWYGGSGYCVEESSGGVGGRRAASGSAVL